MVQRPFKGTQKQKVDTFELEVVGYNFTGGTSTGKRRDPSLDYSDVSSRRAESNVRAHKTADMHVITF